MTQDILKIELRLLLLRYGRTRILEELGALPEEGQEALETAIRQAEQRKAKPKPKQVHAVDLVPQLADEKSENTEILKALAHRYDSGVFLPNLRDVVRFLERIGSQRAHFRSRREAAGEVVSALSILDLEELKRVAALHAVQEDSDFALLAREIMGRRKTERGPQRDH